MDSVQDSYGLSPHVTVHILTNEDKCLWEHATFQGSFRQINHLQFYPCPLGRPAGPWCRRNEGHIAERSLRAPRNKKNIKVKPPLQRGVVFFRWCGASTSMIHPSTPRPSFPLPPHIRISLSSRTPPTPPPPQPTPLSSTPSPPPPPPLAPPLLSPAPLCSQTKWGNGSSGGWQTPGSAVKINDPKY